MFNQVLAASNMVEYSSSQTDVESLPEFSDPIHTLKLNEGHDWLRLLIFIIRNQSFKLFFGCSLNFFHFDLVVFLIQFLPLGLNLLLLKVLNNREESFHFPSAVDANANVD